MGTSVNGFIGPVVLLVASWLVAACAGQTQEVRVTCTTSAESCYSGDGVDYVVNVSGSSSPERPTIEVPPGLSMEFVGGSDRSSRFVAIDSSGRKSERVESGYVFQFRLTVSRSGQFVVPAPRVVVNGTTHEGTALRLRVLEPENDDGFVLSMSVDNDAPYVGEPVRLRVSWRLASSVKNISIAAVPGQDSLDLATPHDRAPGGRKDDPSRVEFQMFGRTVVGVWSEEAVRGQTFRVLTVEQVVVPLGAGSIDIGPMNIAFDAVVGQRPRGFFDAPWDARELTRRVVSRSNVVKLRVRPLPEAGRPAGFGGLVGRYSIKASAEPRSVGVGDPIKLTITVEGPDPLARVDNPALDGIIAFARSFKVSPEGWASESSPDGNPKKSSISIRVTDTGVTSIPALELPYFDPERAEYRTARSDPIPLKVRPTKVVTSADGVGGAGVHSPGAVGPALVQTARGLLANSESHDALRDEAWNVGGMVKSPLGVAFLGAPIAAYAAAAWVVRRGSRSRSPRRTLARARKHALHGVARAAGAAEVSDALAAYVGVIVHREATTLEAEEAAGAVGDRWPTLREGLARLMNVCDASRYGDTPANMQELREGTIDWINHAHRVVLGAKQWQGSLLPQERRGKRTPANGGTR